MKPQTMRRLRQFHHYLGVFFAPAIIFFAFSGLLQTIGLHEARGSATKPAGWIVTLASIHKDQALPRPNAARAEHDDHGDDHDHDRPAPAAAPGPSPIPLKAFVLLVALGLIGTSVMGVTIALNNRAMRRVSIVALLAGTALPILFLFI